MEKQLRNGVQSFGKRAIKRATNFGGHFLAQKTIGVNCDLLTAAAMA